MDNKVTNIHAYNEDGTPYIAVPALSDKALKDGQGNVIAETYATKQYVEENGGGSKTVIPYNSPWSVVDEAIKGDGVCVVEYSDHQYYYSMCTYNPTLGRNFAWFCTPMNPHSKVNGIQVIEVRYEVNAGTTTWSSKNTQTWLTRTDGDSLYGSYSDVEELKQKVTALDTVPAVAYGDLPDAEIAFDSGTIEANRMYRLTDGNTRTFLYVTDTDSFPNATDIQTPFTDTFADGITWCFGVFALGSEDQTGWTVNGTPLTNDGGEGGVLHVYELPDLTTTWEVGHNGHTVSMTIDFNATAGSSGGAYTVGFTAALDNDWTVDGNGFYTQQFELYSPEVLGDKTLDPNHDLVMIDAAPVSKKMAYDLGWVGVTEFDWNTGVGKFGFANDPSSYGQQFHISLYIQKNSE